jgi:hypothetical protein
MSNPINPGENFATGTPPVESTESAQAVAFLKDMEEATERAHDQSPDSTTWGFYAFSDGPVDGGGGTGGFLWFESHRLMLDFIHKYLPLWCPGPDRSNVATISAAVKRTLVVLQNGEVTESVREQLNAFLNGYAQIEWWGRFGELLSGLSSFASGIRAWYWSGRGSGSIPDDQALRFSESLKEYGI